MAIRKIIPLGDPRLKKKCKPIKNINSPATKKLIKDLKDTMRKKELVGIAAPQIGENFKVFLTEPRKTKSRTKAATDQLRVFINPKLGSKSKQEIILWEGCGCTGDLFSPVKRPKTITVQATDEKGNIFEITADGLLGRIFLHELDHLNGIEFVQRVKDNSKFVHRDYYVKHIRTSKSEQRKCEINILDIKNL